MGNVGAANCSQRQPRWTNVKNENGATCGSTLACVFPQTLTSLPFGRPATKQAREVRRWRMAREDQPAVQSRSPSHKTASRTPSPASSCISQTNPVAKHDEQIKTLERTPRVSIPAYETTLMMLCVPGTGHIKHHKHTAMFTKSRVYLRVENKHRSLEKAGPTQDGIPCLHSITKGQNSQKFKKALACHGKGSPSQQLIFMRDNPTTLVLA